MLKSEIIFLGHKKTGGSTPPGQTLNLKPNYEKMGQQPRSLYVIVMAY